MTEANPPTFVAFYQPHKQVYCIHSLVKSVHNSRKKQLYTYLATLGATLIGRRVRQGMDLGSEGHLLLPSSVKEFVRGLYTILGKNSYTLIRLVKARLCLSKYCDSLHNSRKNQLYTYLAYKSSFTYCDCKI